MPKLITILAVLATALLLRSAFDHYRLHQLEQQFNAQSYQPLGGK